MVLIGNKCTDLEEAVQVGSEYLQIGSQAAFRLKSRVAQCDTDDLEDIPVKAATTEVNKQMLDVLAKLTQRLDRIESSLKQPAKVDKKQPICYECQEPGHVRASFPLKKQGKGQGPRS